MHLTICDSTGHRSDGVLLAASAYRMRVMFPGDSDVRELSRTYDQWTLETGEQVELESIATDGSLDLSKFYPEVVSRGYGAGQAAEF